MLLDSRNPRKLVLQYLHYTVHNQELTEWAELTREHATLYTSV